LPLNEVVTMVELPEGKVALSWLNGVIVILKGQDVTKFEASVTTLLTSSGVSSEYGNAVWFHNEFR